MDDLLKVAIESFIKVYADDAKNLFGELFSTGRQFLEKGLKKYLEKSQRRYSEVKTLLHGNTPVPLYSIYHHLNITIDQNYFYSTKNVASLFGRNKHFITIVGDAGSGKSTLIKHLFLDSIKSKFAIPILLELRHLNENEGNVEETLYKILKKESIAFDEDVIDSLLNKGKFIFFFDGFDEIHSSVKDEAVIALLDFINKYESNKIVLTTRPYAGAEELPRFYNYRIGKLATFNEMFQFVNKQLSTDEDKRDLASKIIESIERSEHKYIYSFLTNPLLLSIYILTFQTNNLIPAKKHIFYERVIIALFSEHDSRSKFTLIRERKSNLSQEEIEELLGLYCLYSFFEQKYTWNKHYVREKLRSIHKLSSFKDSSLETDKLIYDLTTGLSLWVDDNGIFSFAHRTLQEYYTARLVKNLQSAEKSNFYDFLITKFIKSQEHPYLVSLLSFLAEMDTFSYMKFFLLPTLKDVLDSIGKRNEGNIAVNCLEYFGYDITCNTLSEQTARVIPLGKYIPSVELLNKNLNRALEALSQKLYLEDHLDLNNNLFFPSSPGTKEIIDKRSERYEGLFRDNWEIFERDFDIEDDDDVESEAIEEQQTLSSKQMIIYEKYYDSFLTKIAQLFIDNMVDEIASIEAYIKSAEDDENKIISILANRY